MMGYSKTKSGRLYLARISGTDVYKLGLTRGDPVKRVMAIDAGMPFKVEYVQSSIVIDFRHIQQFVAIESYLHHRFEWQRIRGEWFELTGHDRLWIDAFFYDSELQELIKR